jgi:hypothetical protein
MTDKLRSPFKIAQTDEAAWVEDADGRRFGYCYWRRSDLVWNRPIWPGLSRIGSAYCEVDREDGGRGCRLSPRTHEKTPPSGESGANACG